MLISFLNSDAFRKIFQSMSEGIIIVDEREFVAANPVSGQILGYEKGDIVGHQVKSLLPQRRGRHINFRETFNQHPEPRAWTGGHVFYPFTFNLISDEKNITD